jgi:hypothetical protein
MLRPAAQNVSAPVMRLDAQYVIPSVIETTIAKMITASTLTAARMLMRAPPASWR